jgi:hypothetical protein
MKIRNVIMASGMGLLLILIIFNSACFDQKDEKLAAFEIKLSGVQYIVKVQVPDVWTDILSGRSDKTATQVTLETINGSNYLVLNGYGDAKVTFLKSENFESFYEKDTAKVFIQNVQDYTILEFHMEIRQGRQSGNNIQGSFSGSFMDGDQRVVGLTNDWYDIKVE